MMVLMVKTQVIIIISYCFNPKLINVPGEEKDPHGDRLWSAHGDILADNMHRQVTFLLVLLHSLSPWFLFVYVFVC